VVEQINDGIILHDIETLKIISANTAYQKMTGYTEEELKGLTAYDLTSSHQNNSGDFISNAIKFRNITRSERKEKRKDGSYLDSEVTVSLISYLNSEVLCIIVRDITEKKKAEDLIKESESRYRNLFESMAQGVVYQDSEGNIISANPAAFKILGLSYDELISRLSIDPKWRSIHKFDSSFEGKEHPSIIALRTGKRVTNVTMRVYHPIDKKHRWIVVDAVPEFRENESTPYRIFTTFTDITEHKLILDELNKSQENLKELNATKDKFFSIVAHDLKSPLQGLLGFSNLLEENYDDLLDEEVKKISNNIYKATKNLFLLIEHLLSWSRLQTNRMECNLEVLELRVMVAYVINLITPNAIGKSITLKDFIGEEVSVMADERMLSSVLENLVSNAIKFTQRGGSVTISSRNVNDFVEVCVSDTGVGIPEEDIGKLFRIDHSHTSKGTDGEIGTGLGLILCHEMIQKLGGDIWVVSEKGCGSSFYFTLPKG
jgi:PAS domain S-box-containing protein